MKEKLQKLLSVKSIVTIVLTAVFAYLSITGVVSADNFMTVFTVVIAFYFGTQHEKAAGTDPAASAEPCGTETCPYMAAGDTREFDSPEGAGA